MTPQAKPLEIVSLAGELADMLDSKSKDEPRLHQIEVRTRYLAAKGGAESSYCSMVLFLLAHLRDDNRSAISAVKDATKGDIVSRSVIANAVIVLASIGAYEMAAPLIERMLKAYPDDKQIVFSAIIHLQLGGRVNRAAELISQFEQLRLNDPPGRWPVIKDSIIRSAELSKQLDFDDSMIGARLACAVEALENIGVDVLRMSRYCIETGEFISQLYVHADSVQCARLNFDIADALLEKFEDTGTALFSIVCRPFNDFLERNLKVEGI